MSSIFEKYQDLLDQEDAYFNSGMFGKNVSRVNRNDPDVDTLFGSEDIAEMQEKLPDVDDENVPKHPKDDDVDTVHFHRFSTRRDHKYTPEELEQIRESCKTVIVHDYSEDDMYHQTDEEREANDMLAELRVKLQGLKKNYNKVDQYIYAMRVVVEAYELIEKKSNFVHTKEEFFNLVSEGRIYINGVPMPRLSNRKKYNMDLIIQYISNPELDPEDLVFNKNTSYDEFYDDDDWDETDEERLNRLLSEEECEYIRDNEDDPPEMRVHTADRKYIKGYSDNSIFKRHKKKHESKADKLTKETFHELLNKIQSNPRNNPTSMASWSVTDDMFDTSKTKSSFWDDLYYDGSWTDKYGLWLYDLQVDNKFLDQHPIASSYVTTGDQELERFFNIMEANGLNVIELRRSMNMEKDQLQARDAKIKKKDNKKVEAALLQRITKLNNNPKFKKLIHKASNAIDKQGAE